jgi:hypothetical protein
VVVVEEEEGHGHGEEGDEAAEGQQQVDDGATVTIPTTVAFFIKLLQSS